MEFHTFITVNNHDRTPLIAPDIAPIIYSDRTITKTEVVFTDAGHPVTETMIL